jgi:fused signal recognition particle receptor
MFGFLKDKLKKAINAFSKSAEEEVKEEKVDDQKVIEQAKQEEKKSIPKKAAKPEPKKVEKPKAPAKAAPPTKTPPKEELKKQEPTPKQKVVPPKEEPKLIIKEAKPPIQKPEKVKKLERQRETKVEQIIDEEKAPKKGFFSKLFGKKEKEEIVEEALPDTPQPVVESVAEIAETVEEIDTAIEDVETEIAEGKAYEEHTFAVAEETVEEEKSGFFSKLKDAFTKKTLTAEKFDELFWELELAMLENNVAVEVIEKIKKDLRDELTSGKVSRMGIEDIITARLRRSIEELFDVDTFDFVQRIKEGPKPYKICIIGVNGSGKTTTLAKIIHLLKKEQLSVVVAASDTFRAAAIDQLKEHTDKLDVRLISQGYGADPAAVAFDAIKHAEAKDIDVVLIDTAGRLHSNTNLMAELEKVVRVAKPDMKIFVGESITGNDCVEQAQVFNKLVGIDAIILSKADIDEKGGAAISVSYVTGKPILFLGMGQTYDDLIPFDKEKIIESLELE